MTKPGLLYPLIALLLVATAPWPFTDTNPDAILGFPPWAFYSLSMTALFGITVAVLLQFCWPPAHEDEHGE